MDAWKDYTAEELDLQVTCEAFKGARSQAENVTDLVMHFREHWISVAENTKKLLNESITFNQAYGDKPRQKLDIYGTDLDSNAPTLFWIHGGGWHCGSKLSTGLIAGKLHSLGIRTVGFGYTKVPEARIGEMQEEVKLGLEMVMQLHPDSKFLLGGHSAGAQLCASVLHNTTLSASVANKIEGVILYSGVYDLRPLIGTHVNVELQLTIEEATDLSALLKTIAHPDLISKNLPVHTVYGGMESQLFQKMSTLYSQHLINLGLSNTTLTCSELDDHFSTVENINDEKTASGAIFDEFLGLAQ